jgi:hypothetical protein
MAEERHYGQPRRLNALTFVMLLGALGAGYWLWRFFPMHFDSWSVDHILKEAATSVYRANQLAEPARTQELKDIVDHARSLIVKQVGIHDPELVVDLNLNEDTATVSADYSVVVTHPWLDKNTRMHFHREKTSDVKRVKWE